jgi:phosphoglycerate dehydrogenase-like enzyme
MKPVKIAILDDYQQVAKKAVDWSSLPQGSEVDSFAEHVAGDELVRRLQPYDVIVAMRERTPFREPLINALPNLRLLISTGGRNASIDIAACERRGIAVASAEGARNASGSTSEVAWALILALFKRVIPSSDALRAGEWQTVTSESLAGKVLGLVGLGRLGTFAARAGQAFGMEVIAWSPNLTDERAAAVSVRRVSKEALFAEADVISVHMVLSDRSRGIVGAQEIAGMKRSAYLVNTSRGPLIDEKALMSALQERRIAGAGLDVFWEEPLPKEHPIRRLDNVVLTPHLGYVTDDNLKAFYTSALKNVNTWLAGGTLPKLR